ncbi:MAG TPA: hypothetical protein VF581_03465 [Flavobacterium sp.]|jgi:hypothetical protein
MNKFILLAILVLSPIINSQSLVFDNTFGTEGKMITNFDMRPYKAMIINNQYYFVGGYGISKFNYDGSTVTNFGTNGRIDLPNYQIYHPTGAKAHGSFIYLFGKTLDGNDDDIFIAKVGLDGVFDTSFGIDGICRINLGADEVLSGFEMDSAGKILGVGTRYSTSDSRLIYLKINPNGTLDNSFAPNGYKEISYNVATTG